MAAKNSDHGVSKPGIHQEPLDQILGSLEVAEEFDDRTVYSNPLGVDCPCCGKTFHRAIHGFSAWSTVGAKKPLEVCIGDTPDGRIVFAHVMESNE